MMGLFSSSRARRTARAAAPESENGAAHPASAPRPEPSASGGARSLRDALHQIYSIRPSREAFAEEAVRAIAKAAGIKSVAMMTYEHRQNRLRLIAASGLEPGAIQVLAGNSSGNTWDIPLRSLRNRRINVIEAAHENPFVPPPLVAINKRRLTIAVMPFYHSANPIGVIVLFSPTPRGFADGLLQVLSQALKICATAMAELPSSSAPARAGAAAPPPETPNLLRGLAALKSELSRLTQALEETERQRAAEAAERVTAQSFLQAARERTAALEQELNQLHAQQGRLPVLQDQIQDLNQRLHDAVVAADGAQAQVKRLQEALAETQKRAEGDASTASALAAARAELQRSLETATAAVRERDQAVASLQAQLAEVTKRAAEAEALETSLAESKGLLAEAEAELARMREASAAVETERHEIKAALEESSAALAEAQARRQETEEQLAQARARVERLQEEAQALAEMRGQIESVEAAKAALLAELDAARKTLAAEGEEHAAAIGKATARIDELESERQRLRDDLDRIRDGSDQSVQPLREQMGESDRERRQLAEQIETLRRAESERAELQEKAEQLERELQSSQETARTLEARVEELNQVSTRLIAERRDLHARIEKLAAGGQTLEQEKQAAINSAQHRVTELEAELSRVAALLESTRFSSADEIQRTRADAEEALQAVRAELAVATRERDELQQTLSRASEEGNAHQQTAAELSAERERLQAAVERLGSERDGLARRVEEAVSTAAELRRGRQRAEERIAELERDLHATRDELLADVAARLEASQVARREMETAIEAERQSHGAEITALKEELERQREELGRQLAALGDERQRLTEALAEKDLLLRSAEEGLTAIDLAESQGEADETMLAIDRSYAPEHEGDGAVEEEAYLEEESETLSKEMLLLDDGDLGGETARQLAAFGHRVTSLVPEPEATGPLRERPIACAAINLAIPTSWRTLRHLRNGSGIPHTPLVAYALAPSAPKGFWLGPVDFALLPVSSCNIADILNRMVPRVRRVIAMSNDIDVMSDVRTHLSGAGVSTAVVLDGRQALDLVATVRPEAAVLHLSPSCVDVFRAIAGLRASESSRDVPILFLLDAEAQPREEAFLTAGVRMLSGRGNLMQADLTDSLASALDQYRAA
jgi:chromosome segregation ATPase